MSEEWKRFANCKGMDVNWFFDDYETSNAIQLAVDKACSNCVVRKQCLDWALEEGLEGGVFGRKFISQTKRKRKSVVSKQLTSSASSD